MEIYLHDSAARFRFVLRGDLTGGQVPELEQAWTTAKSILKGRDVEVDVSGLTNADRLGLQLLSRMRDSGARLTPAQPLESGEFLRFLGVPAAAPGGRLFKHKVLRFLGLCRA